MKRLLSGLIAASTLVGAYPASASSWWPAASRVSADTKGDTSAGAVDLVRFGVGYVGYKMTFEAQVASTEDPAGALWRDSDIGISWILDFDNGEPDVSVDYYNDGSKVVAEGSRLDGTVICDAEALFAGGKYIAHVDADCLDNPPDFRTIAYASANTPSGLVEDFAPDNMAWLPIAVSDPRLGYWMVGAGGEVYGFGKAVKAAGPAMPLNGTTQRAVDLEPTPSHNAYWVLLNDGMVISRGGDATPFGSVDSSQLQKGEETTSIAATPTGGGYWIFTSKGRVFAFGDAKHLGDMSATALNGPVLDSIATPSGKGYYMVASDGGIFSFGDAVFQGSMGGKRLVAPVQSLVPDPDGGGYWLVASDGGIFAFGADFHGSMGDKALARPVTGMVAFGNGYLMVGEDGGIFNFSDLDFMGSLGATPPAMPITSVAVLDES